MEIFKKIKLHLMKKQVLISAAVIVLLAGVSSPFYFAQGASGNPFDEIWKAIADIRTQISSISKPGNGGHLHLYDAANQDLGEITNVAGEDYFLYNPTIQAFFQVHPKLPQTTQSPELVIDVPA